MRLVVAAVLGCVLLGCGAGAQGPEGPEGPPGPAGMSLSESVYCSVVSNGLFRHQVYKFSDNSVMATCEVGDSEYGVTSMSMYKSTQQGATTAYCSVTNDWDGTLTSGYWVFAYNGTSSTATYNDSGSGMNGQTRSLTCTKN